MAKIFQTKVTKPSVARVRKETKKEIVKSKGNKKVVYSK